MRRRRAVLMLLLLLAALIGGTCLWLRAQYWQNALNRALIAALVHFDDRRALFLVNEGADPNTRYKATVVPSLQQLWNHLWHQSPLPVNDSPTALLIVCGGHWNDNSETIIDQLNQPSAPKLAQAMLRHGANVNAQTTGRWTALHWAVWSHRNKDLIRQLLENGANPNLTDVYGESPFQMGQDQNDLDIVALLKQYGAQK